MTAKEKLRNLLDELSETEAAAALDFLKTRRGGADSLAELLDNAPIDDEPTTPEEEEGVREAREEILRGEVFSAEQVRREFG